MKIKYHPFWNIFEMKFLIMIFKEHKKILTKRKMHDFNEFLFCFIIYTVEINWIFTHLLEML